MLNAGSWYTEVCCWSPKTGNVCTVAKQMLHTRACSEGFALSQELSSQQCLPCCVVHFFKLGEDKPSLVFSVSALSGQTSFLLSHMCHVGLHCKGNECTTSNMNTLHATALNTLLNRPTCLSYLLGT